MKEIQLTQGLTTLVDDEDYEYLMQWKWYASLKMRSYYAKRLNREGQSIYMHRIIMDTPDSLVVDHIDHDGLNNQKSNLRNCTFQQNKFNKLPYGRSKYLGVSYAMSTVNGKLYEYPKAIIQKAGKSIYLGTFKTEEDAARAYDKAAKELFGEFANLNFK